MGRVGDGRVGVGQVGDGEVSGAEPEASAATSAVAFTFDGRPVTAPTGSTIGAALWAAGIRQWRTTRLLGRPRSLFCGIGQCFDCLVRVNGGLPVRACVTDAITGDEVRPGDA